MKNNLKIIGLSSAGVLLILPVVLWFIVLQPGQQIDEKQAQESLVSGINLYKEKKYNEAFETLQRIPSGSAHEAKARYYQGSAQMMLKDYDAAMSYLQQALVLNNHDSGVLYALGVVSYKLGNIKLAKSYFASVLQINPNDQQAKGLMDIMARLERRSATKPESKLNNTELQEKPSQQTNLTSPPTAKQSKGH